MFIDHAADPLPFPILEHVALKASTAASDAQRQLVVPLQTTAQPTGLRRKHKTCIAFVCVVVFLLVFLLSFRFLVSGGMHYATTMFAPRRPLSLSDDQVLLLSVVKFCRPCRRSR
jgi:hypothetical protein